MSNRLNAFAHSRSARLLAILPIVIAASLAAGCSKSKSEGKASQAAARVNGDEITVHQINQVLEQQRGLKPEQADGASRQILESLIDQQLAVAKAEEQKLDRDPAVVQMIDSTRRSILARAYLEKAAASAVGTPSPEDVRKYFDSKPGLFSQRKVYALQEFTVPCTPAESKAAIEKLRQTKNPEAFIEVLKATGLKFNATQNTQAAENLPLGIVDQLAKVGDGEALYLTANDGFKAVVVVASRAQPVSFDQAKPAIEQFLLSDRRREFVLKEVKNLRTAAKLEYIGKFADKPASGAAPAAASEAAAPVAASAPASEGLDPSALSKGLSGLK
jgi:EpsD family peptidyl-prolyl cis-trans isomerase